MDKPNPRVTAVILALSCDAGLTDCLRSLEAAGYDQLDILVVRNGPRDESFAAEARAASRRVSEVIFVGFNSGFAAGNNIGMRRALEKGADYVLLLNDDTVVDKEMLGLLVREGENNLAAGMLGPEVRYFSERERISFRGAELDRDRASFRFAHVDELASPGLSTAPLESDYITGCALLARKSLLERIGLLDERFFLYWEDSDWGVRAKQAGFRRCVVVPAAKVWHKLSVSSGGQDSPLKVYYKTRNRLLFAALYAPGARPRLLAGFIRDLAWLAFKSREPGRRRIRACAAAILDYFAGHTGRGPAWL